jgi:hypothetical protein
MQTKIFQKTTPDTTKNIKDTDADVGSDRYMVERGYHRPSQTERERYGKFVNRERFFSIVRGMLRRLTGLTPKS